MLTRTLLVSLIFIFSSCSDKKLKKSRNSLRIGGSFNLLTLDQYSVNALGDSFLYKLIYDQVIDLSKGRMKSKFLKNVYIKERSLFFDEIDEHLYNDLFASYKEGLSSVLWSSHFKKYRLSTQGLMNKGEGSFEDLKIISSYWMLKGKNFGRYKVKKVLKNQRVTLISKEKRKKVTLYRVKSQAQGVKSVSAGELDVYINDSALGSSYKNLFKNLNFIKDKEKSIYLRLYKKDTIVNYLGESIAATMEQTRKLIDRDFALNKKMIGQSQKKIKDFKKIEIIFNDQSLEKVVDTWSLEYKSITGKEAFYESLSDNRLSKKLSKGIFDYYFSLEVEGGDSGVYFESFHTQGKYNTFKLSSRELDLLLEKKRKSWDLVERRTFDLSARRLLRELDFIVLEWKAPFYGHVTTKDLSLARLSKDFKISFN